jgi:sulfur-carrier protein
VATVRLFASAREAAGTDRAALEGTTVGEVLDAARIAFGPSFAAILDTANVWLNGDQTELDAAVSETDEIAVLPPVSGGA